MDAIREVIATLYLACAYAAGPAWLSRANALLVENADDPEMDAGAAHMLRTLAEQSSRLYRDNTQITSQPEPMLVSFRWLEATA